MAEEDLVLTTAAEAKPDPKIYVLFRHAKDKGASDLYVLVEDHPAIKVNGTVTRISTKPETYLTRDRIESLILPLLTPISRERLDKHGGTDFRLEVNGTRFRVNVFSQKGTYSLVARRIEENVRNFRELGLPDQVARLTELRRKLVLISGVTGSGKSTTLAAMVEDYNTTVPGAILTLEDPIEFGFRPKTSLVFQREYGIDFFDWKDALKQAMRQAPGVILVGEMRDGDTFLAGLQAAETGHTVYGTTHAGSAVSTIGRILAMFPKDLHQVVRESLVMNLGAIVAQRLIPGISGTSVPMNEVVVVNAVVRDILAKGAEEQRLQDVIDGGAAEGMLSFASNLKALVDAKRITTEVAIQNAPNPDRMKMILRGVKV